MQIQRPTRSAGRPDLAPLHLVDEFSGAGVNLGALHTWSGAESALHAGLGWPPGVMLNLDSLKIGSGVKSRAGSNLGRG